MNAWRHRCVLLATGVALLLGASGARSAACLLVLAPAAKVSVGAVEYTHHVRADPASLADHGAGAHDTVRPKHRIAGNAGRRVDHRGGMPAAPLGEPLLLVIEIAQQHGHGHGDGLHREEATPGDGKLTDVMRDARIHDEDGGIASVRRIQLRDFRGINQAVDTGILGAMASLGMNAEVTAQIGEQVGMIVVDGLG
jgi:hypothetical protein